MDKQYNVGSMKNNYDICGCIHIHSTYSDGTESIPEIAAMANELGLDYIIITDHMTLQSIKDGMEKAYDSTLVLIGYEINDIDDTNHYLALGLEHEVNRHLPAKEYVEAVRAAGGLGIIAHPHENRDIHGNHPPYPWTAWDSDSYHGIEIWNQLSEWVEGLNPFNQVYRFIHPRKTIIAPKRETLEKWDEDNLNRVVTGIGGVDAHAHYYKVLGLFTVRVFHYKVQFKTIRTHICLNKDEFLTADFNGKKKLIYTALKNSSCYVSNFRLGDASGFRFWADWQDNLVEMGETVMYQGPIRLNWKLPRSERVKIIKNGEVVAIKKAGECTHMDNAPGIFRLEVIRGKKPWIFSNHIRFRGCSEK